MKFLYAGYLIANFKNPRTYGDNMSDCWRKFELTTNLSSKNLLHYWII